MGSWILNLNFIIWILVLHFTDDTQRITPNQEVFLILLMSFIFLNLLRWIVEILMSNYERLYQISIFLLLIVYNFFSLYHFVTKNRLEYSLVYDNFFEIFTYGGFQVIYAEIKRILGLQEIFLIFLVFLVLFYVGIYNKKLKPKIIKYRWVKLPISFLMTIFFVISSPFYFYDELAYFGQTAIEYHFPSKKYSFDRESSNLPDIKFFKIESSKKNRDEKPNIILIMMESLNGNFVDTKNKDGKEYMPVFNSYIRKGLYLKNFYAHSVQTAKGHFSILCGLLPLVKDKAFYFPNIKFNCLPKILKKDNYRTYFIQGYKDYHFDNAYSWLSKNGFDIVETTKIDQLTSEERKRFIWGWGIQDNFTYKQALDKIEELYKKEPRKPVFAAIATISHHVGFDDLPHDMMFLYPNPQNRYESFANSIHLSDRFLKTFFEEFDKKLLLKKNTLIVVTGDHSFPAGEHGSYYNETGAYKENFKTSLIMLWANKISPETKERFFSQQDIAASVLDIIGWSGSTHFMGNSFFSKKENSKPIALIQPYDGVHIGGIVSGYKYMYHYQTGKQSLYNLLLDPLEKNNLFSGNSGVLRRDESGHKKTQTHNQAKTQGGFHDHSEEFKNLIKTIHYNEHIILNNNIPTSK